MGDKQFLLDTINESELPGEVKNDLIQRIASEGATKEIAMEVADLLDLQADVFDMKADAEDEMAKAYEKLATELRQADEEEESSTNAAVNEFNKQLDEVEQGMKALDSEESVPVTEPTVQPTPQETPKQ